MTQPLLPITLIAGLLASALAPAEARARPLGLDPDPGALCDRLAATNDGTAKVPPVKLKEMNAPAAEAACRAAIEAPGRAPRHHLQLARALLKLGEIDRARGHLTTAAAGGNAAALYILGQLHHTGTGVDQDKGRAYELYRKALRQGYREAAIGLLVLFEDPGSPHFDPVGAEAARMILMKDGRL